VRAAVWGRRGSRDGGTVAPAGQRRRCRRRCPARCRSGRVFAASDACISKILKHPKPAAAAPPPLPHLGQRVEQVAGVGQDAGLAGEGFVPARVAVPQRVHGDPWLFPGAGGGSVRPWGGPAIAPAKPLPAQPSLCCCGCSLWLLAAAAAAAAAALPAPLCRPPPPAASPAAMSKYSLPAASYNLAPSPRTNTTSAGRAYVCSTYCASSSTTRAVTAAASSLAAPGAGLWTATAAAGAGPRRPGAAGARGAIGARGAVARAPAARCAACSCIA
jgi:hypothetical protein